MLQGHGGSPDNLDAQISSSTVVASISSNGNPGVFSNINTTNNVAIDQFEGGLGSLPTTHTCGVTTTTTTTTGGTTTTIPPTVEPALLGEGVNR